MVAVKRLRPGDAHYKAYVGPPDRYDFMGATQFRLLVTLGLRQDHKLLDFGCGSLRAGKMIIPYLGPGNYYGIEPNQWLIEDGLDNELGQAIVDIKKPTFMHGDDFTIGFDQKFDFIVAQSVFSHTDMPHTVKGIGSIRDALKEDGRAVLTFVEGIEDYDGEEAWLYPNCTTYRRPTIARILNDAGVYWRRLPWFHPAQTWYLFTLNRKSLPSLWDTWMLLGGEEVQSGQYRNQKFFSNRLYQLFKPNNFKFPDIF